MESAGRVERISALHVARRFVVKQRLALCALGLTSLLAVLFWPHAQNVCSDEDVKVFLDNLCHNYTNGHVVGSVCAPLCTTKEIRFTKCIGHHLIKLHVFEANWNGKPVIFKTIRPKGYHRDRMQRLNMYRPFGYNPALHQIPHEIDQSTKLTRRQFIKQANTTLYYGIAGKTYTHTTRNVLEKVVSECDVHGDGILDYDEVIHCWQLVETEEYILSSLLRGTPGICNVYGVCGSLYAVEFTPTLESDQYLGYRAKLCSKRPWKIRAKLSIAILDMLESFENTPYGDLHFCDCKEHHYGIVEQNGNFVSKLIDLDSAWLGPQLNTSTHACSDKVVYNSLQIICQFVFRKEQKMPTILYDPPSKIKAELESLLDDACANSESSPNSPQRLLDSMRDLLLSSIS